VRKRGRPWLSKGSNVHRGHREWHITAEDGSTRLEWLSVIEPDFWVPPFIVPTPIRGELENQGRRFVEGVEAYARSHPISASEP
jgi:hypothetical protein